MNGLPFTVVGVFDHYESEDMKLARRHGRPLPTRGGKFYNAYDQKNGRIVAPFNTIYYDFRSANVVGGIDQGPVKKVDGVTFQVTDPSRLQDSLEEVTRLLLQTHRGVQDFNFDTRQELAESIEKNARNTRLTGGLIAGISLIVGGIGITNIMLASITERIREIGVRRAVGAKARHIFMQILIESTVVGVIGGLMGLVAAVGMTHLIAYTTDGASAPIIQAASVLLSFLFAVVIGVASGIYPAWRASRIAPIEALRYG